MTVASEIVEKTSLDVIRETFNFEVEKFPISGPDGLTTPLYGMWRSDNHKFVGKPVSKKYVPHQTQEIILLGEALSEVFENEMAVTCDFLHGHRLIVRPSKEERLAIFGTEDNIFPRIYLRALYDGHAVSATMGWMRDTCRNLARAKTVKGSCVTIRHSKLLPSKMQDLIKSFRKLRGSWDQVVELVMNLENKVRLNVDEFIVAMFGEPKQSKRGDTVYTKKCKLVEDRIVRERERTGRATLEMTGREVSGWEAFNSIQGYSQWDQGRHKKMNELARAWKAMGDTTVLKAEKYLVKLIA